MKKQLLVFNPILVLKLIFLIDFLLVSCKYKRRNCRNEWTPVLTLYGFNNFISLLLKIFYSRCKKFDPSAYADNEGW